MSYSEGQRISTAWQCYFCSNYYSWQDKFDRHVENCTGRPGYVYNFNMQSLLTFKENLKYRGDILLVAYIDLETSTPTDQQWIDPENRKLFAVSYIIIFTFHPDLHIDRVIIERSFGHSLERLADLSYLTHKQLKFKDEKTLLQLKDYALAVHARNSKIAISEMFTTELKFASDCLQSCFNAKFKSNNLELSNSAKRKYEIENPVDWSRDRCCIRPFPLEINASKFDADSQTMSYVDFMIFREHKFLRNIFSSEEIAMTDSLKDLKTCHQTFVKFLKVIIILQNALNTHEEFSDCFDEDLLNFCRDNCADCSDFNELKETIGSVKVKNNPGFKISNSLCTFMCLFTKS